jgi:hypothetical protein
VLLVRGTDYTATTGTSVVLASGALVSDTLLVVAYGTFTVANAYTQTQSDARYPLNTSSLFAGKNKLINADFGVWQRGTTTTTNYGFVSDRWQYYNAGAGAVSTMSQQAFTPGNTIAGYEPQFFLRMNQTTAGTGSTQNTLWQQIEDVRTFAGQTVTFSFWAKAASGTPSVTPQLIQYPGTGGSAAIVLNGTAIPITTSWVRYSQVISVPSLSGKTIGTSNSLSIGIVYPFNVVQTIDTWGVQLEAGTVATAFQTATGTIQGELAACQRYYWRAGTVNLNVPFSMIATRSTTAARTTVPFPVFMRVPPTSIDYSTLAIFDSFSVLTVTALTSANGAATIGTNAIDLELTFSGSSAGRPGFLFTANGSGYLGFSAEL